MSHGGIALGQRGERLAERWYLDHGYSILARNWRCEIGEVDLIATRDGVLVIAEVKTRVSERFGLPAEAVGYAKQQKLRRLAAVWLSASTERFGSIRFDVVSIIGNRVDAILAAF